jgi:hypothetical protein
MFTLGLSNGLRFKNTTNRFLLSFEFLTKIPLIVHFLIKKVRDMKTANIMLTLLVYRNFRIIPLFFYGHFSNIR